MRIACVTPEYFPFSKTGGLADVAHALSVSLLEEGCEISVFTPAYRSVLDWFEHNACTWDELVLPEKLWIGDEQYGVAFRILEHQGVRLHFVLNGDLFDRERLYVDDQGADYRDNAARFSFFCRAVLEYYLHVGDQPDIFHAHDWQAALLPAYLKTLYAHTDVAQASSLFTIHNLGYQGLFPAPELYATGLGWEWFSPDYLEYYGGINLLKAGIVFADALNTVSPTYAKEIQTPELGKGLDGLLHVNRHKLCGILNGIDNSLWDPATDPHLPANFSVRSLAGKAKCKRALQQRFGLPARTNAMLLGIVSRFDIQKGIALVLSAFPQVANLDLQLAVLGTGSAELEAGLAELSAAYPQQVAVRIGFEEPMAHLIEAGADAFLMPSAYEPCGLNQLYSQRYGTVPIVRETGGLKDTVANASPQRLAMGTASGFTFRPFEPAKLADAIRRAARLFHGDHQGWRSLMLTIMRRDFSWQRSAGAYLRLYEKLARAPRPQPAEVSHG